MKSVDTLELLHDLNGRKKWGDQEEVARLTGFTTTYVSQVLDPNHRANNAQIITALAQVITDRERAEKKAMDKVKKTLAQ